MNKITTLLCALAISLGAAASDGIRVGAGRMYDYLPELKGKKVGVVANHTALVDGVHLVDTLIASGVDVAAVFAPEHGFRGDVDAGANVSGYTDRRTGVKVISIYGPDKKPSARDIAALEVVVFDIQDVGLRYYTYLSSMHYVMESCAENGVPLIVLDRPNPNGMYVDGPILEREFRSFVGMHPIPVVHGMTLGELARMINGEGWLEGNVKCDLRVVRCLGYTHQTRYRLPVRPSPNLPDMRSVYLYASLCFFEGTPVSIGRGTPFPFQVYGHPGMSGEHYFSFTPKSVPEAGNPPQKDRLCYGTDLRSGLSDREVTDRGVDLTYLIDAYRTLNMGEKFFTSNLFEKLTGVSYVRRMILQGKGAQEIEAVWKGDVEKFIMQRKPYLLYEE